MSHLIDPHVQHGERFFPRHRNVYDLTDREREIIELLSRPSRERRSAISVAVELGIAEQTLKNHLVSAYKRLGVRTLAQAVRVILDRRVG